MITLLDLNYTLVANSTEKKRPFAMQISPFPNGAKMKRRSKLTFSR